MPFNGSGIFNRVHNWVTDAAASVDITDTRMDAEDDGFATGLTQCITKNGETTVTANLPMATFRHTGVGNGSARTDYSAVGQIQDGALMWGGTAGGTADALTISLTPAITAYATGMRVAFIVNTSNTASATLAVNGLVATTIKKNATANLDGGELVAGKVAELWYDGTNFQFIDNVVPGVVVQNVHVSDSAVATGTTLMPTDDTIPQNTEGDEYMTLAITPASTTNRLVIEVVAVAASTTGPATAGDAVVLALFQDLTAGALAATWAHVDSDNTGHTFVLRHEMAAGTVSATTFKARMGANKAGTTTFNGHTSARALGGVMSSSINIMEITV